MEQFPNPNLNSGERAPKAPEKTPADIKHELAAAGVEIQNPEDVVDVNSDLMYPSRPYEANAEGEARSPEEIEAIQGQIDQMSTRLGELANEVRENWQSYSEEKQKAILGAAGVVFGGFVMVAGYTLPLGADPKLQDAAMITGMAEMVAGAGVVVSSAIYAGINSVKAGLSKMRELIARRNFKDEVESV